MAVMPVSYAGAEEKGPVYSVNVKQSMLSEGYLPLPFQHKYYYYKEGMTKETGKADFLNCIEGQRRIISYGRMSARNEETKPYLGYNSTVWITIRCMKNKGYVEMKHKIFEYPYEDHASIDY